MSVRLRRLAAELVATRVDVMVTDGTQAKDFSTFGHVSRRIAEVASRLRVKGNRSLNVPMLARAVTDQWYNQTLCEVNGSVVRLGVMQGEYHWHEHEHDDEFFFCLEGEFLIDLEGRTISLGPQQGVVVPKGGMHRTRAPQKCITLMVENAGIVPTAD
jgi:mannose-6-phosphate isomerase-like protein (cupin superfamily)